MDNEQASVGGRHLAQRRRRRPTALVAAACILLVLALGIGGFVFFVNQPAQSLACREGNLPLVVVVSPDQATVVSRAAAEYERRRPVVGDRFGEGGAEPLLIDGEEGDSAGVAIRVEHGFGQPLIGDLAGCGELASL